METLLHFCLPARRSRYDVTARSWISIEDEVKPELDASADTDAWYIRCRTILRLTIL